MKKARTIGLAAVLIAAGAFSPAYAGRDYDRSRDARRDRTDVEERERPVERRPERRVEEKSAENPGPREGTRVYGFTGRPGSCGEFKYWDGEKCTDARQKTPAAK